MRKLAVLLGLVGILMIAVSMAQAQSQWAYYKENPVQICTVCPDTEAVCYIVDGYTGPKMFVLDSTEIDENGCKILNYTLDCCACHGPDAPGNHGGPKLPAWQCP